MRSMFGIVVCILLSLFNYWRWTENGSPFSMWACGWAAAFAMAILIDLAMDGEYR